MSGVDAFFNSSGITATKKVFSQGSTIFYQDEPNPFLYFIEEGSVKMTRADSDGEEVTMFLSKGDRVGTLMEKEVLEASAFNGKVTALVVSKANFRRAITASGRFALETFLRLESKSIENTLKLIWSLAPSRQGKGLSQLINNLLLMVVAGHATEEAEYFSIGMSHNELSKAIGATRETTTRRVGTLPSKHFVTGNRAIKVRKSSFGLLIAEEGREELLTYKEWLDSTKAELARPPASVEPDPPEPDEPAEEEADDVFMGEKLEKFFPELEIKPLPRPKLRKFKPQCPIYGKALDKVSEEECLSKSSMAFWAKETCGPIACRHPCRKR